MTTRRQIIIEFSVRLGVLILAGALLVGTLAFQLSLGMGVGDSGGLPSNHSAFSTLSFYSKVADFLFFLVGVLIAELITATVANVGKSPYNWQIAICLIGAYSLIGWFIKFMVG